MSVSPIRVHRWNPAEPGYVMVPNTVACTYAVPADRRPAHRLSGDATLALLALGGMRTGWEADVHEVLEFEWGWGRGRRQRAMAELVDAGYLVRHQVRARAGRYVWVYDIHFKPVTETATAEPVAPAPPAARPPAPGGSTRPAGRSDATRPNTTSRRAAGGTRGGNPSSTCGQPARPTPVDTAPGPGSAPLVPPAETGVSPGGTRGANPSSPIRKSKTLGQETTPAVVVVDSAPPAPPAATLPAAAPPRGDLHRATDILDNLPPRLRRLTRHNRSDLTRLLVQALHAGYDPAELGRILAERTDDIERPYSVLRYRLRALLDGELLATVPAPAAPARDEPWCGACESPGYRWIELPAGQRQAGLFARCPDCNPHAVVAGPATAVLPGALVGV